MYFIHSLNGKLVMDLFLSIVLSIAFFINIEASTLLNLISCNYKGV
jgi:hypothetical protein